MKINSTVTRLKCGWRGHTSGLALHSRASFWASLEPSRSPPDSSILAKPGREGRSSTGLLGTFRLISLDPGSLWCLIRLKSEPSPWMKMALGNVQRGKACSGWFVFHLSLLPDYSSWEWGSFFPNNTVSKPFRTQSICKLFLKYKVITFENKYFGGRTTVCQELYFTYSWLKRWKFTLNCVISFSATGLCHATYKMQPWLPPRIKTFATYIFIYTQLPLC